MERGWKNPSFVSSFELEYDEGREKERERVYYISRKEFNLMFLFKAAIAFPYRLYRYFRIASHLELLHPSTDPTPIPKSKSPTIEFPSEVFLLFACRSLSKLFPGIFSGGGEERILGRTRKLATRVIRDRVIFFLFFPFFLIFEIDTRILARM